MYHKELSASSLGGLYFSCVQCPSSLWIQQQWHNLILNSLQKALFSLFLNSYHASVNACLLPIKAVYTHKTLEEERQNTGNLCPTFQLYHCPALHKLLFFSNKTTLQIVQSNRGQCHFVPTDPYKGNKLRSQKLVGKKFPHNWKLKCRLKGMSKSIC